MEFFSLPERAKVNRVVPKNAFDAYATAKQKKLFTSLIARITWLYKLSPETVNLEGKDVQEIQSFRVELKQKDDPQAILNVIEKAIPYHLIFIVVHEGQSFFSASAKHLHPLNADNAVIDWTFKTEWKTSHADIYSLDLRKNLDSIFNNFCLQLAGKQEKQGKELADLVQYEARKAALEKEVERLKIAVKNCKQFKIKVELNLALKVAQDDLSKLKF